jgi:L-fuculose-phosphate aldolase
MAAFDFEQFGREFADGVNSIADSVVSTAKDAGGEVVRTKQFIECGHDLFITGAVTSHGGNLSTYDGRNIHITRTNAMLGHLTPNDIITCDWEPGPLDQSASMELVVHRAIHHALAARAQAAGQPFTQAAIVHAHTLYTVLRSLDADKIEPIDSEGLHILGGPVPVVAPAVTVASEEVAVLLGTLFTNGANIVVVRGHGPFAAAATLREAYRLVSCLEFSARLLTLRRKG